jgi:hypothetical protein
MRDSGSAGKISVGEEEEGERRNHIRRRNRGNGCTRLLAVHGRRERIEFREWRAIECWEIVMQASLRRDTDEAHVDSALLIGHQIQ